MPSTRVGTGRALLGPRRPANDSLRFAGQPLTFDGEPLTFS